MGLSAYSQALGSPLPSSHWAMRTAVCAYLATKAAVSNLGGPPH